jgi:hypothetical protein
MSNDSKFIRDCCVCPTVALITAPDWQFSTAPDDRYKQHGGIDVTLNGGSQLELSATLSLFLFLIFQEKYIQVRYASRSPLTLISPIFMRERYIFRKYDNCFLFYGRTKMNKLEQLITKQKEI